MNSWRMFDWNDLRHFLAVARSGKTAGAGRQLGVSQPTVVRRIAAFEQGCGLVLFDRQPTGYRLTDHGRQLLPMAERIEIEAASLASHCAARRRETHDAIRFTAPETLTNLFIMPALAQFRARHPGVEVQLIGTDSELDVLRGEADVALRAGYRPLDGDLVGRRLPDPAWSVYGSREYFARTCLPLSPADLGAHSLIAGEGPVDLIPPYRWLSREAPDAPIVWRGNTLTAIYAAVQAGLGLSMLPCALGGRDAALVQCFPPIRELDSEMWIVTRPELRRDPRVRALMDAVHDHLVALGPLVRGERDSDRR
jgi:DNA-binding transcriptional LysR family regulator